MTRDPSDTSKALECSRHAIEMSEILRELSEKKIQTARQLLSKGTVSMEARDI